MQKKISVIVPIYNCEQFLEKCLNSILEQKFDDYELILIDDGSSDKSAIIVDEYEKRYDNIRVLHKENGGVSAARNDGIHLATGKYITFIDGDDYVSNNYFSSIINFIKEYPNIDLYNFGFFSEVEDNHGNVSSTDKVNYCKKLLKSREEIKNNLIDLYDNTMLYNPVNKVYLKEIIDQYKIKFPNYNWGEDVEFNRRYLNNINSMYNSDICLYHYVRERETSITKRYKHNLFEIRVKEFFEFNEYFEKWEISKKDYYEFSCRRYIERILGCIENEFCSNLNLKIKYKNIKSMIKNETTREAIKYIKPKSKKISILIIPIKLRSATMAFIIGWILHIIKDKMPSLFNKLKNKR